MEHMNFNAHDQKFQNQIINAYRDVNKSDNVDYS